MVNVLDLDSNSLTSFVLPAALTNLLWNLTVLDVGFNVLVYRARSVPWLQTV